MARKKVPQLQHTVSTLPNCECGSLEVEHFNWSAHCRVLCAVLLPTFVPKHRHSVYIYFNLFSPFAWFFPHYPNVNCIIALISLLGDVVCFVFLSTWMCSAGVSTIETLLFAVWEMRHCTKNAEWFFGYGHICRQPPRRHIKRHAKIHLNFGIMFDALLRTCHYHSHRTHLSLRGFCNSKLSICSHQIPAAPHGGSPSVFSHFRSYVSLIFHLVYGFNRCFGTIRSRIATKAPNIPSPDFPLLLTTRCLAASSNVCCVFLYVFFFLLLCTNYYYRIITHTHTYFTLITIVVAVYMWVSVHCTRTLTVLVG